MVWDVAFALFHKRVAPASVATQADGRGVAVLNCCLVQLLCGSSVLVLSAAGKGSTLPSAHPGACLLCGADVGVSCSRFSARTTGTRQTSSQMGEATLSGQLRVEQFPQDPSSLSYEIHVPPTFAKSAAVITRSQMQTSFAVLSRLAVAPTHLLLVSSQNHSMINSSRSPWIAGPH